MSIEDLSKIILEEVYPNPHLEDLDDDLDFPPIHEENNPFFEQWNPEGDDDGSEKSNF